MAMVRPENRIIGPKPLAHVPGINSAPDIGIPVSAAIPFAPDNKPNLRQRCLEERYLPPIFLIGDTMAQQTGNRLTNAPLTNPKNIANIMIAALFFAKVQKNKTITAIKIANIV